MANGAFKFKDNSGNVVSFISGSGSDILISGGTLNLSGMTGLTLGNLTMSGTTQNAVSTSHAASYLLTSSFNSYTGTTNTIIGSLQTSTGSLNTFTSSTDGRLTSIETSTGSLNSYTTSTNTRLGVIESTTSSLNTYTSSTNTRLGVIESTTSSLNTFTSSATNRLNSIEGVTGSYATTGSNTFNGNLTVTGYIDAQELRTTYISSSILYRSGSTKFGDELTDTHTFTGSVLISGSLSVPGSGLVSGSSQILNGSGVFSGSAQLPSGTVSGSVQVDVMSTTNIAHLATTGSNVFTGALTGTSATFSSSVTASSLIKSGGTSSQYLMADGSTSTLTNPVTGTGTTNYLPKFTGTSTIGNSIVQDSGGVLSVGGRLSASGNDFHSLIVAEGSAQLKLERTTTSTGLMYLGADNVGFKIFDSAFATRLTLTSSGNLGLGVTPSAWSGFTALQIQNSSLSTTGSDVFLNANCFFNGSNWRYISSAAASQYYQDAGSSIWRIAPSGTAGNAISFTQAMTLNASGNLSIGNTNNTYKLDVTGQIRVNGSTNEQLILDYTTAAGGFSWQTFRLNGVNKYRLVGNVDNSFGIYSDILSAYTLTIASTGAATFSSSITATNIILNSINSVTSTAGQNIINSTYSGTDGNWFTIQNAGGILYAGLENSISTTFGATAYAGVLYLTGARNLEIFTSSAKRLTITSTGIVQPGANGTQDLGTASLRWGTVYTSDLSLSNGVGDYTIVEGENDLFLYNNKQNKVYKFLLAEVNPSEATPKKS